MNTITMNTITGSISYQPTASRELKIPNALDELVKEIEALGKVSEEFCLRVEKVCTPSTPIPNAPDSTKVEAAQAEYVENLKGKARQIRRIRENLENTMQRLEL